MVAFSRPSLHCPLPPSSPPLVEALGTAPPAPPVCGYRASLRGADDIYFLDDVLASCDRSGRSPASLSPREYGEAATRGCHGEELTHNAVCPVAPQTL